MNIDDILKAVELVPEVKAHLSDKALGVLGLKYDPNQPRVPAGDDRGGEWVGENVVIGRTVNRQGDVGNDIYKIKDCSDLAKYNLICVSINGDDIYASQHYGNHNDILRAVDPNYSEDDYVRISSDNGTLIFHTEYAGIRIDENFDRERALKNIYKTLDKLVQRGLPSNTKVIIYSIGAPKIETSAKSIDTYDRQLWKYALDLYRGGDPGVFITDFVNAISNQLNRAWREGALEMGVAPADMTDDDRDEIQAIINAEYEHILDLGTAITAAQSGTIQEFRDTFRSRIDMWVNRYTDVKNQAKIYFGGKTRLEWVEGDTLEKCPTCLALNGIVAFAQEWEQSGVRPQSPPNNAIECGGWNCSCTLQVTDKRRSPLAVQRIMDIATAANV